MLSVCYTVLGAGGSVDNLCQWLYFKHFGNIWSLDTKDMQKHNWVGSGGYLVNGSLKKYEESFLKEVFTSELVENLEEMFLRYW